MGYSVKTKISAGSPSFAKVFGTKPQKARSHIGYVPQYLNFDNNFPVSVIEVVLMSSLKTFLSDGGISQDL